MTKKHSDPMDVDPEPPEEPEPQAAPEPEAAQPAPANLTPNQKIALAQQNAPKEPQ